MKKNQDKRKEMKQKVKKEIIEEIIEINLQEIKSIKKHFIFKV